MAVTIKSSQEIELMRQAGKILAKVHEDWGGNDSEFWMRTIF